LKKPAPAIQQGAGGRKRKIRTVSKFRTPETTEPKVTKAQRAILRWAIGTLDAPKQSWSFLRARHRV